MIKPKRAHDALLADIESARRQHDVLHLWWLGQSGFLLQWQARHLLTDPYLSDSLTKKYAGTDKPHVRMTELVVDPRRLDFIDAVTSSHNHTDHLDAETLVPLLEVNPDLTIIVPAANRPFASQRLGIDIEQLTPLADGATLETAGFLVHGVPAAHESIERDEAGRCKFLGYVIQCGPWTIYHSGDTVLYDGMVEQLSRWQIDVALLPINGRSPQRRVPGNLSGPEAAQLGYQIRARLVIPCHYDMFQFNTEPVDLFVKTCEQLGQPYRVLRCGEKLTVRPR